MRITIVLALLLGSCFIIGCTTPPPPMDAVSQMGTWQLIRGGGLRDNRSRFKLITDSHYTCIEMDAVTGTLRGMHGGTYSLVGDTFTESVEFADPNWQSLVNMKSGFAIRQEDDKLFFVGKYHDEVWQRVPEGADGFIRAGNSVSEPAQSPFFGEVPAPLEISNELSELLGKHGVNVSFSGEEISPEGDLTLIVDGSTAFAEGATIKLPSSKFRKLNDTAQTLAVLIKLTEDDIASGKRSAKLKGIDLRFNRKIPVR